MKMNVSHLCFAFVALRPVGQQVGLDVRVGNIVTLHWEAPENTNRRRSQHGFKE